MKASDIPVKMQIPFGNNAGGSFIRAIPTASRVGIEDGAASLETGFPPLTFNQVEAGGVPPFGQDVNGILFRMSGWNRWQSAGGPVAWDSTFSAAIGGYPKGAIVASSLFGRYWISTADDNVTNPDSGGAGWEKYGRIVLLGNLNLYVSTTGNDTNDGLSPGTPFQTLQHAWNVLQQNYDGNFQFNANINVGVSAAPYFAGIHASGPVVGFNGSSNIVSIIGDVVTPANCFIGDPGNVFFAEHGADIHVRGFKTQGVIGTLAKGSGSKITIDGNMEFNIGSAPHIYATQGGQVDRAASYILAGTATAHLQADMGGLIYTPNAITVAIGGAAIPFSTAFAIASDGGIILDGAQTNYSMSNNVTGVRFSTTRNGVINTAASGNANYYPGSSIGVQNTGGQYA